MKLCPVQFTDNCMVIIVNKGCITVLLHVFVLFQNYNMLAIRAMLTVLDDRLKATSRPLQENVVPIVSAFCQMARGDRVIRKYLRQEVLPPLGRVGTTRPEEGHLIRNQLVRLMTSPMEDIKVGGTQL